MMKQIISLIAALATLLCLASCSPSENTDGTTTTTEQTTTTTTTTQPQKKDPEVNAVSSVINIYKSFKAKTFESSEGKTLPYRLYLPAKYSEEYTYPVVLFLHGAGERGNDNSSQLKNVVQKLFNDKSSPFYQCIVVCPQCPSGEQWVNTPWANGNYRMGKIGISDALSAAVELMDSLLNEYSINPDRQYVMGISMGGFGTWDLVMRYPDRFAAAIPICGGADPSQASRIKNVPIQTFHDNTDPTVPVAGTREMVQAIEDAGGTLITYTETSGYGHLVWDSAVETEGLFDWLFAQRKQS